MLTELHVRNLALVEDASIQLNEGFVAFTGETGAGKSLLVDAIGLLLGAKASGDKVRSGAKSAEVEGVFNLAENLALVRALADAGFAVEPEDGFRLVIRREISGGEASRNRIWIQGRAATRNQLQEFLGNWVEVSGQHEFLKICQESYLLNVLDSFGGLKSDVAEYGEIFQKYRHLKAELEEIVSSEINRVSRLEFLKFQIDEMENAGVHAEIEAEELELERLSLRLGNLEKLRNYAFQIRKWMTGADPAESMNGQQGVAGIVQKIVKETRAQGQANPEIGVLLEASEKLQQSCDELENVLSSLENSLEVDPGDLEAAAQKLSILQRLKRKHFCDSRGLARILLEWKTEISVLENSSVRKNQVSKELAITQEVLFEKSERLHQRRSKAAVELGKMWTKDVRDLGLEKAQLEFDTQKIIEPSASGPTRVQVLFSANPGETKKPINKVASGGELSRILLSLKNIISGRSEIGVFLFDEIDTGIGGQAALRVAKRLQSLAKENQVLVVTHLATLAAHADQQFLIQKQTEKGRTRTFVNVLDKKSREIEVARMLGGDASPAAQRLARELISSSQKSGTRLERQIEA